MLRKLIATDADPTTALLRIALGLVILPHGAQKLLGWFGGFGPSATIGFFESTWGVPAMLTSLVIAMEFLGGLALLVGLLSRFAAVGIAAVMVGAVALNHWGNGFFMNWTGAQPGEGFEYHVLAVALAAAVVIRGAGAWSIDGAVTRRVAQDPDISQDGPVSYARAA